jgi:hypothetical protein
MNERIVCPGGRVNGTAAAIRIEARLLSSRLEPLYPGERLDRPNCVIYVFPQIA